MLVRRVLARVFAAAAVFAAGVALAGCGGNPKKIGPPGNSNPPPQPTNIATDTRAHETQTRPTPTGPTGSTTTRG